MKLYLYCNSGVLLEYFTINKIVSSAYLYKKDRKIAPSFGLQNGEYIFLTKSKLCIDDRKKGIENEITEYPITIELTFEEKYLKQIPVVQLDSEGKITDKMTTMAEIKKNDKGLFILGEIPFQFVTGILFESNEDKENIYRPSKDLFFPEKLYKVFDHPFVEKWRGPELNTLNNQLDALDLQSNQDAVGYVLKRNKITAIVLNTILETTEWPFGTEYIANFDEISTDLLRIKPDLNTLTKGLYYELQKQEQKDELLSCIALPDEKNMLSKFYRELLIELINYNSKSFTQENFDFIKDRVLKRIESDDSASFNIIKKALTEIEKLVYGASDISLDKLLSEYNGPLILFRALIFFLRNPNTSKKLADGLEAYKANPMVRRYTWIMFAALNGVEPISNDKTGNEYIMTIAYKYAMEKCKQENMINFLPEFRKKSGVFKPIIEKALNASKVRTMLLSKEYYGSMNNVIKQFVENKLLSKGFKEKNYRVIDNPFLDAVPKKNEITEKEFDEAIASLKKKKSTFESHYNISLFLKDYIEPTKKFEKLYNKDVEFWNGIYSNKDKK